MASNAHQWPNEVRPTNSHHPHPAMHKGEESYDFIGHLAIALYTQRIKIRLTALQKILNDKGADYGGGVGMGKVVTAAYNHWKKKDWVIHHAIAASFTGQNDEYLFE